LGVGSLLGTKLDSKMDCVPPFELMFPNPPYVLFRIS
jgi:hypothetical protein